MATDTIRIGSRGSDLALWQAHWVRDRLMERFPGTAFVVEIIKTTGDRILDAPLSRIGDKGLFTREIEHALLTRSIDLAVHSLKDLPTSLPDGLRLGAVTEREDVRDVFLPRPGNPIRSFAEQPQGAHVATGSLRRTCQLLHVRPDLKIVDIRGNLNTRYKKLTESDWAGMILARAGVLRLGWEDRIGESLDPLFVLPAVGQGALGIEIRSEDNRTLAAVAALHHQATGQSTTAERALLRALEGGCQVPIGAYARVMTGSQGAPRLVLDAMVGSLDGKQVVRGTVSGSPDHAEELGGRLAADLLERGARGILDTIRSDTHGNPAS
ncbi:MAG: hydroxymethylbilane synthase [Bacteroidetes bacterium]|nr:hydroxymethylbilane synthase [Bacteroidota bacterium]